MTKEIPLTQGKFALVDDEDFEFLNQWKWCVSKKTHHGKVTYTACRSERRSEMIIPTKKRRMIFMHRVLVPCMNDQVIDHINHDSLDNRKKNLRCVTQQVNCSNRSTQSNNTSGLVGVNWHKRDKTWRAFIGRSGTATYKHIGSFKTAIEAALAYDEEAEKRGYLALNYPAYASKDWIGHNYDK